MSLNKFRKVGPDKSYTGILNFDNNVGLFTNHFGTLNSYTYLVLFLQTNI